jgi:hypothetical protein
LRQIRASRRRLYKHPQHGQDVIQMNEVRHRASGGVQRAVAKVTFEISDPGHPAGEASDP